MLSSELERFKALNEELDAKKAQLILRADQLIKREGIASREASARKSHREMEFGEREDREEREREREREREDSEERGPREIQEGQRRNERELRSRESKRREEYGDEERAERNYRRSEMRDEEQNNIDERVERDERQERREEASRDPASRDSRRDQARERPTTEKNREKRLSSAHNARPHEQVTGKEKTPRKPAHREQYANGMMDDDDDEAAVSQLGPEAAQRYLLAKLRVVKEELRASQVGAREKDAQLTELTVRFSELSDREAKLAKSNNGLESQLEKLTKTHAETTKKLSLIETQLAAYKKESDMAAKLAKNADQDKTSREARLHRALEEAERLKAALKEVQQEGKEGNVTARKKTEKLETECKRLERLNGELLGVIRKQMRLVDVLKRAKVHMEAVQLLGFTEAEFSRTLELGDKL